MAIGLGGVGLSVVAGARLIIAVDVSAEKAMLARAAVPPTSCRRVPVSRGIRALTGGRGADYAFECLGRADPIRSAWQSARRGGRCVVAGMGAKDDPVEFSALELFHFARTLTSSVYGARRSRPGRTPRLVDAVLRGELDLAAPVTHRIALADVPAAFDRMRRGVGARSLVLFDRSCLAPRTRTCEGHWRSAQLDQAKIATCLMTVTWRLLRVHGQA
ncbi:zinc-binding dehydrogenase [Amycolatopsis methanolica]|uniref:zinc-binding dehydrogenase n=1 Tax=Amycolatopsis methanolica TaxID=1814 RepID=UPI0034237E65